MSERIFRKLGLSDLHLVLNMDKEVGTAHVCEENARLFLSNPMNWFFACIEDDKILGVFYGYELNRLNNDGNMLYIHAVGVHSQYRRQGIAEKILISIKETCKLLGICKIFLSTQKSNVEACGLYEKCGGGLSSSKDDSRTYYFKP
jgi:ribosomal protein S18 acetylase RimI-like enzyme